jgi:zinc-binding alcohol dehydrogenase family protein
MKAVAIIRSLPANHPECFVTLDLPQPQPGPRDLLVRVKAVAVNPVDYKVRQGRDPERTEPQVLGWDAAGVVENVGAEVSLFRSGDEVYYAGDITRQGSDAEYQLVDERIVGRKPARLSFAEAAALPLTTITAWETLFERMKIPPGSPDSSQGRTLLILGGAGGVGSIAIQLAKHLAGMRVIASASRPESAKWCRSLGADATIDHRGDWLAELKALGCEMVDHIACFNDTDSHWQRMSEAIAPQGSICSIVETEAPLDLNLLKSKSAAFVWEFMFTRPMFRTPDMIEQHRLLTRVADLLDQGTLRTTLTGTLGALTPGNLSEAHRRLESGSSIGKLVLTLDGA